MSVLSHVPSYCPGPYQPQSIDGICSACLSDGFLVQADPFGLSSLLCGPSSPQHTTAALPQPRASAFPAWPAQLACLLKICQCLGGYEPFLHSSWSRAVSSPFPGLFSMVKVEYSPEAYSSCKQRVCLLSYSLKSRC